MLDCIIHVIHTGCMQNVQFCVNPIHGVHVEHKSSWKMTICTILFNSFCNFCSNLALASLEIVISILYASNVCLVTVLKAWYVKVWTMFDDNYFAIKSCQKFPLVELFLQGSFRLNFVAIFHHLRDTSKRKRHEWQLSLTKTDVLLNLIQCGLLISLG